MKTTILACLSLTLLCATAYADTFGSGSNTFDIEFVTIGNADNPDDTTGSPNPAGKVEYAYRIGQFEISEEQKRLALPLRFQSPLSGKQCFAMLLKQ